MLESVQYPGQHIGVLPSGEIKPTDQTGTGQHARFTPVIIVSLLYTTALNIYIYTLIFSPLSFIFQHPTVAGDSGLVVSCRLAVRVAALFSSLLWLPGAV